ncbi:MAG: helix-turn-helix domain-containing protein [Hyphomicrobiaceae bacterium]|nr:helix-turn-helix domain-containing protein [Hyphomicrobiaceae bacterium]
MAAISVTLNVEPAELSRLLLLLHSANSPTTLTSANAEFYRVSDLTDLLGICRQTIWQQVRRGYFPAPTIRHKNGRPLWDRATIADWQRKHPRVGK